MCKSQTTISFRLSFPADGVYGAVCRSAFRWTLILYHMRSLVVSQFVSTNLRRYGTPFECFQKHALPIRCHHPCLIGPITGAKVDLSQPSSCAPRPDCPASSSVRMPRLEHRLTPNSTSRIPSPKAQVPNPNALSKIPSPKSLIPNSSPNCLIFHTNSKVPNTKSIIRGLASTEHRCLDLLS